MKENTYKTVNTFSRKPCINQILSYVLIVAENISFWGFVQPNLVNEIARVILISLFILTLLILVISTCMTSYTDPSDSTLVNFRSKTHQKYNNNHLERLQIIKYLIFFVHTAIVMCQDSPNIVSCAIGIAFINEDV